MPLLDVTRSYSDNTPLLESHFDDMLDDLETFLNTTQLDDFNIVDATIDASTKLINGSISTAKIANDTVTSAKIAAGAVTTIKIADGVLTNAKFIDGSITAAKIASGTITSTQVGSSQITNAKFADGSITRAKRANDDNTTAKETSSAPVYTNTTTSFTAITSRVITSTGRPIHIHLDWNGNSVETNFGFIRVSTVFGGGGQYAECEIRLKRDSTIISVFSIKASTDGVDDFMPEMNIPPTALWFIDQPSSGTYTYSLEGRITNATPTRTLGVSYVTLLLMELP